MLENQRPSENPIAEHNRNSDGLFTDTRRFDILLPGDGKDYCFLLLQRFHRLQPQLSES
ncbi:hypothetical protein [Neisseria chenwenguii]|uniref:hypothetical protein n=1 Tax=Neisseria chenwenguii TaxID=1853278 RepID=UPI0012FD6425|nr:hypothetical protein [Neisseria chenwenguii]